MSEVTPPDLASLEAAARPKLRTRTMISFADEQWGVLEEYELVRQELLDVDGTEGYLELTAWRDAERGGPARVLVRKAAVIRVSEVLESEWDYLERQEADAKRAARVGAVMGPR